MLQSADLKCRMQQGNVPPPQTGSGWILEEVCLAKYQDVADIGHTINGELKCIWFGNVPPGIKLSRKWKWRKCFLTLGNVPPPQKIESWISGQHDIGLDQCTLKPPTPRKFKVGFQVRKTLDLGFVPLP